MNINKTTSKTYCHGKNFSKRDARNTPVTGEPNTNLDTRNKETGDLVRRRKFDEKGNAKVDMDEKHSHNQERHSHDFIDKKRQDAREMTKKEKREFEKANNKKRKL